MEALLGKRLRELVLECLEHSANAEIPGFRFQHRRVETRDIEQRAQQVLNAQEAALDAGNQPALLFGHFIAMLVEQGGKQFRRIERLEQVVRGGGQKARLRRVGLFRFGFRGFKRAHRRFQFGRPVNDTLFQHFLCFDKRVLGRFEVGDIRVGRHVTAVRQGLAADFDDLAVDKSAFGPVGGTFPHVANALGDFFIDIASAQPSRHGVIAK